MNVLSILLSSLFSILSCSHSPSNKSVQDTVSATSASQSEEDRVSTSVKADTLYSGLTNPWGMVWLPDGRLLITERSGEILVFKNDKYTGQKISGVPEVFAKGQGGLMDIKLHPKYKDNGWIYLTYSKPLTGGASTAVMRAKLKGNELVAKQDIFVADPALPASHHFGSRITFDNDGYMFISAGERGTNNKVQELSNDHGKIHRLFDDGRVPEDNPFVDQAGAKSSIWTYGHRNPQGLVYDKANNRLWEVEHGPKGGDELNLIEKGKNYGWPLVTYGINYDGKPISDKTEMEGVQNPVKYWVPSPAPCGMTLIVGDKYPGWQGNLLIANLAFKYLGRIELKGTQFVAEEKLLKDVARVRYAAQSPDGYIYVVTEGPGKLLKLIPEK
jgi:aldose sugar dehydrogenase